MHQGTLNITLRYAGHVITETERTCIYNDPSVWYALLPDGALLISYNCSAAGTPAVPVDGTVVPLDAFAAWLVKEYRPQHVQFLLHTDLLLPLRDSEDSPSEEPFATLLAALHNAAITVGVAVFLHAPTFPVGQWVRSTQDYADMHFPYTEFVTVPGMLGRVEDDPYGVTTPGISVMVKPVGRTKTYGYPCSLVVTIAPPSEAAIAESQAKAELAWEDMQKRGVWVGILQPGLSAPQALSKLKNCLAQLRRPNDVKARAGYLKRTAKFLEGVQFSPMGARAMPLAARCRAVAKQAEPDELHAVLAEVEHWITDTNGSRA